MVTEDVAIALRHEDGGDLVRKLYGHRDKNKALDRAEYARTNMVRLRIASEGGER